MKKLFYLLLSTFLLISCSNDKGYYDDINYDAYSLSDYASFNDVSFLNSVGEQRILVVPIVFKDCSLTNEEIDKMENDINITFFGKDDDLEWESVSSYYYKSSYGKLNITGEVLDTIAIDKTPLEIANLTFETNIYNGNSKDYYDNSYYPIMNAYEQIKDIVNLSDYDLDKDGRIDSIWFVYGEEAYSEYCYNHNILYGSEDYEKISSFLWSYTYFYPGENNVENPSLNAYAFASYKKMLNKNDAHVFIHETGHLLGLKDYYNYNFRGVDETNGKIDYSMPTGGLDMMDLNIGDHNSYSKFLLNWIKPKMVYGSFTYTMKSSSYYDDVILIPISKFNNSPFFNYLLIEYYTPNGLNEYDSKNHYKSNPNYPKMFDTYGFKIYLVKSSLGYKKEGKIVTIDDFSLIDKVKYYDFVYSNTPRKGVCYSVSKEDAKNNRLITLLSATGKNNFFNSNNQYRFARNTDLFNEEDAFEYTFAEEKCNIKITFSSLNEESGTLNVEVK